MVTAFTLFDKNNRWHGRWRTSSRWIWAPSIPVVDGSLNRDRPVTPVTLAKTQEYATPVDRATHNRRYRATVNPVLRGKAQAA
jgi:hypothetical protein